MAIFYVKSGGSATGDGGRVTGAARTGTWSTTASEYYDNVEYIFGGTGGTAITEGDFIYVSSAHDKGIGSAVDWTGSNGYDGVIHVVSVDNANQDQRLIGGKEIGSGGNDMSFHGRLVIDGMEMSAGDDFRCLSNNGQITFLDCTLGVNGNGDKIQLGQDGAYMEIFGGTVNLDSGAFFEIYSGAHLLVDGADFNSTGAGQFIDSGFFNGGGTVHIKNCTGIDNTGYLVGNIATGTSTSDRVDIKIINCPVHASLTGFVETLPVSRTHTIEISGCSSDSDEAEYQYYYTSVGCYVEHNTTIYRDESPAWADTNKTSLEVVTHADMGVFNLFHFDFPEQYIDVSAGASDVIRFYFASTSTLNPSEVYFQVSYVDGTTKNVWNIVSTRDSDPLNPGTLTSDTGSDWRNGAGAFSGNEYYIDASTVSDQGAAGVVGVRAFVGIASATVYFDMVTTQS